MKEIWKDIKGYEGIYQVSKNGTIKSLDRYRIGKKGSMTLCKGRILAFNKLKNGYVTVHLSNNGTCKALLVHRLVASTFIPNPDNLPCVDHINGVRSDNRKENLRWCSYRDNLNYPLAKKNISKAKNTNKVIEVVKRMNEKVKKPIVIVFPDGQIKEYSSVTEAEKDGFYHPLISACCKGKQKTHRKCKCYYKEDYYGNKS